MVIEKLKWFLNKRQDGLVSDNLGPDETPINIIIAYFSYKLKLEAGYRSSPSS